MYRVLLAYAKVWANRLAESKHLLIKHPIYNIKPDAVVNPTDFMTLPFKQGQFAFAAAAVYHFVCLNYTEAHARIKLTMEYPYGHFSKHGAVKRLHAAAAIRTVKIYYRGAF